MSSSRLTRGRRSKIDHVYSITTIVHDRQPIFLDAALAAIVIDELRQLSARGHVRHFAWVLMPEHLHWLFALRRGDLAYCVQLMKGRSARAINIARCGSGRVWQPGYFDHALRRDEAVRVHARYLMANPLRAGLVEEISEYPHQWCAWDIDAL
jgi:putative transposase